VLEQLKAEYGDDLRVVFRHFPLISIHDKAQITAEAAEAAGVQDKFWEMHDVLFERQSEWNALPEDQMIDALIGYAEEAGVEDLEQFRSDLENETFTEKIEIAYQSAIDAGLTSTPSFAANQVAFPAEQFGLSFFGIDAFLQLMTLRENWFTGPEQVLDPDKEYTATIQTDKGDIVIDLFTDTAPVNTNSFAFLANEGWYQNITFHRVLEGFVAQAVTLPAPASAFPAIAAAMK
jgi:hypothetical protein